MLQQQALILLAHVANQARLSTNDIDLRQAVARVSGRNGELIAAEGATVVERPQLAIPAYDKRDVVTADGAAVDDGADV